MEQITKEILQTCIPANNINDRINEEYINLYNKYRMLLTKYFIKKLRLKLYDELIENSGLNFKPVDIEKQDLYQYFSSDNLKYVYIRNNVYIDRLTDEEKQKLNTLSYGDNELSKIDELFIEETYKKVIFEDKLENNKKTMTFFGPRTSSFMIGNDYVVIGIRYDKYYNQYGNDEEWKENFIKQSEFITNLIFKMKSELCLIIDNPVTVIEYGDMSTIKLTQTKNIK